MSTIFDITITAINKAAPADGSIDCFKMEYYRGLPGASDGNNYANMTVRRKGHVRWHKIENQFSTLGNLYVSNKVAAGADTNTVPTSVAFRITAENGSASLYTYDENNAGQFLTGIPAIKRVISRALTTSLVANCEVWDPAKVAGTSVVIFGYRIVSVNTGALAASIAEAESNISITAVN